MANPVKYYTHVNRHKIDSNRNNGTNDPVITIKRGKNGKPTYAHEVELPPGSRMLYSAHDPILPCGARLVIVSDEKPRIVE